MGNHQSEPNQRIHLAEIRQTHRRGGFIMHKRQKMGELKNRRQSMPVERLVMDNVSWIARKRVTLGVLLISSSKYDEQKG